MRNFWRFGLVLLIAVVACSDKKAEQATALKTEIEGLLAKAAGPDKKNFSYGDVAVTPGDGDEWPDAGGSFTSLNRHRSSRLA